MVEWKEEIRPRLARLKLEPTREAEIVEELAQHFELRCEELLNRGVTSEEASRAVLAELSDGALLAQELGESNIASRVRPWRWVPGE